MKRFQILNLRRLKRIEAIIISKYEICYEKGGKRRERERERQSDIDAFMPLITLFVSFRL